MYNVKGKSYKGHAIVHLPDGDRLCGYLRILLESIKKVRHKVSLVSSSPCYQWTQDGTFLYSIRSRLNLLRDITGLFALAKG